MRWEELDQESCSLARALSVVGDRWTLLVLRDCFLRVRRFEEFERRLGITRHILADRLRKLCDADVLRKVPYNERPLREEYRLTEKGLALYPVIHALVDWGDAYMSGQAGAPIIRRHKTCGHVMKQVPTCSVCGEIISPLDIIVEVGPGGQGNELPSSRDGQEGKASS